MKIDAYSIVFGRETALTNLTTINNFYVNNILNYIIILFNNLYYEFFINFINVCYLIMH